MKRIAVLLCCFSFFLFLHLYIQPSLDDPKYCDNGKIDEALVRNEKYSWVAMLWTDNCSPNDKDV